ncbi:unnamed protein product [Gadus morhua 'NCC']
MWRVLQEPDGFLQNLQRAYMQAVIDWWRICQVTGSERGGGVGLRPPRLFTAVTRLPSPQQKAGRACYVYGASPKQAVTATTGTAAAQKAVNMVAVSQGAMLHPSTQSLGKPLVYGMVWFLLGRGNFTDTCQSCREATQETIPKD